MSTMTQLEAFSRQHRIQPRATHPDLHELWADGVATLAIVTLVSFVAFEMLRIVLN
jgi:hypothetical protein